MVSPSNPSTDARSTATRRMLSLVRTPLRGRGSVIAVWVTGIRGYVTSKNIIARTFVFVAYYSRSSGGLPPMLHLLSRSVFLLVLLISISIVAHAEDVHMDSCDGLPVIEVAVPGLK